MNIYPTTVNAPMNAAKSPINVISPPLSISPKVIIAPKTPKNAQKICDLLTELPNIGIISTIIIG